MISRLCLAVSVVLCALSLAWMAAAENISSASSGAPTSSSVASVGAPTGYYNVMSPTYGAVNNGTGNQGPAINAAITAANAAGGGTVFLPAGTYHINLSVASSTIVPLSNVTIQGAGAGQTFILCDDTGESSNWQQCIQGNGSPISNFTFRDITVQGYILTANTQSGTVLFGINPTMTGNQFNCSNITVRDSEFLYGRYFSAIIKGCDGVRMINNHVAFSTRDSLDVWGSSHTTISNNKIEHSGDDSISCQEAAWVTNTNLTAPQPSGCIINNNIIEEGQGIRVLGATSTVVANNMMRRTFGEGIYVETSASSVASGQAAGANYGVNVINNTIMDVFARPQAGSNAENAYIEINGGLKSVLVNSYGATGTTGLLYQTNADISGTSPGGGGINVSGNVLMRSLPANSVGYSDWGYGQSWVCNGSPTITCGYDNTPVPEANLNGLGIWITAPMRNSRIANNIISTTGMAISFPNVSSNLDYDGLEIVGNQISDCYSAGACIHNSGSNSYQRILIKDNTIDVDPRFLCSNRGTNGTWTGTTGCFAINLASFNAGVSIIQNKFRNAAVTVQGPGTYHISGNLVYANLSAGGVGCNAGNTGIGCIPTPFADNEYQVIPEDGNPNSGTFGTLLSNPTLSVTAQPSSGTWVQGTFIRNSTPALASCGIAGWLRLTTGTGNTAGTDWTPAYTNCQPTLQVGANGATVATGETALAKIAPSGSAPGAGFLKFEAVAGTNTGSCKIVAYAGTSTTPVTIVDNVGSGC